MSMDFKHLPATLSFYKGIAIIAMIGLHSLIWAISGPVDGSIYSNSFLSLYVLSPFTQTFGWLVFSFVFLTGIAFRFLILIKAKKNVPLFKGVLFKIVVFLLLGFWLNPSSWYILQFFSLVFLIVTPLYVLLKEKLFYIVSLLFYFFYVFFKLELFSMTEKFGCFYQGILLGPNNRFFWPLFPWIFLFIFGMFFMKGLSFFYFENNVNEKKIIKIFTPHINSILVFVGLLIFNITLRINGTTFIKPQLKNFWGNSLFHPTEVVFWAEISLMITFFGLFSMIIKKVPALFLKPIVYLGSQSFIVYLIHYKFMGYFVRRYTEDNLSSLIKVIGTQVFILVIVSFLLQIIITKIKKAKSKGMLYGAK